MKPSNRSSSKRRIYRRTPSGKTKLILKERKNGDVYCEICGSKINLKRDKKIVGNLCNSCLQTVIAYYARIINNDMKLEDVDLIFRKYVEKLLESKK
jgi:ribosomal protein L34E